MSVEDEIAQLFVGLVAAVPPETSMTQFVELVLADILSQLGGLLHLNQEVSERVLTYITFFANVIDRNIPNIMEDDNVIAQELDAHFPGWMAISPEFSEIVRNAIQIATEQHHMGLFDVADSMMQGAVAPSHSNANV